MSRPLYNRRLSGEICESGRHSGIPRCTLEQLSADAAQPALRAHKLRGSLAGCWACSADYDLRIVFEYTEHEGEEAILLLALGTHDQVY